VFRAGCGYQAAVLAHLVKEVIAVERIRGLPDGARRSPLHQGWMLLALAF